MGVYFMFLSFCPDYYNGLLTHLPASTLVLLESLIYGASTKTWNPFSHLIIMTAPALLLSHLHSSHALLFSVPHTHRALHHPCTFAVSVPWAQDTLPHVHLSGISANITSLERLSLTNLSISLQSDIFSCWGVLADEVLLEPVVLMAKIHSHFWCFP